MGVDDVAEREFRFTFKQVNFWSLHELFAALRETARIEPEGSLKMTNDKGEVWTPENRDEMEFWRMFGKPGVEYALVAKSSETIFSLYGALCKKYSDYVKYFLVNDGKA